MTDRGEMEHKGGDNRFWKGGKGYLRAGFRREMTFGLSLRWLGGM